MGEDSTSPRQAFHYAQLSYLQVIWREDGTREAMPRRATFLPPGNMGTGWHDLQPEVISGLRLGVVRGEEN